MRSWLARRQLIVSVAMLAALAYVPALTAAPGRMPSDSKLYVYLNPSRFLVDTTTTFDPRQYAGWVPHQHIAYLWPTGPWFWVFDRLGVPDWVAHRLWIGTLLLAAGLGVRWVARVLGLGPTAALTAAIVYQLSPYILPYVSRTSVLLLPFAGLGWIVGLTVLAADRGRWRYAAGVALVVFTVGAVNATALAMIIPAPALWLVHAVWQRTITWRRALVTAAKVSVLSIAVSLWWIAMLMIQGRRGADVLAYSESLESVSFTSTSTEVLRGLGYWLFYIRDAFGATTTASLDYMASAKIIVAGVGLLTLCLLGLVTTAWQHRRYAALLVAGGTILAVGVHPIDDPSPVMSVLLGDGEGGLALALRSSTRAIPVLLLGLGLGAAALVSASQSVTVRRPAFASGVRIGTVLAVVVAIFAVANMPSLRNGGFVDPELERDQEPPDAWLDAAAQLDALPDGYRVLQLPGSEFGSFRWGHTVDQPLPALTERPLLTRDLLPLGSPAAMDLVFALDDRFQDGVVDVAALAPIARLLGVDTFWVADDVAFDRYRLARPEIVDDVLTGDAAQDAGLLPPKRFGAPRSMTPDIEMIDEQSVSDPRVGQPLATVSLVGVSDPVPTIRVKDTSVVVSGSADGLVDAAAAGVIDGSELILYSASFQGELLAEQLEQAQRLVVTDSNRDRAHHWRGSQDVTGYTESGGAEPGVLRYESGDQRLPVFETTDPATQTVSVQQGPVTATASAYGEPFAYLPEHRPVMAIDGDLATSWVVADRAPAIGEFISFDVSEPVDHITLRQPDTADGVRRISSVEIRVARGRWRRSGTGRPGRQLARRRRPAGRHHPDRRAEHDRRAHRGHQHRHGRARTDRRGRRIGRIRQRRFRTRADHRGDPGADRRRDRARRFVNSSDHLRVHPPPHRPDRPLAVRSGTDDGPPVRRCKLGGLRRDRHRPRRSAERRRGVGDPSRGTGKRQSSPHRCSGGPWRGSRRWRPGDILDHTVRRCGGQCAPRRARGNGELAHHQSARRHLLPHHGDQGQ